MKHLLLFNLLFFAASCIQKKGLSSLEDKKSVYKVGDCIMFKVDSVRNGTASIWDIKKDEGEIWYAICFMDYVGKTLPTFSQLEQSRLSGRKVESGINPKGYEIGLDIEWMLEKCIIANKEKLKMVGHFNFRPVEFMSEGSIVEYDKFLFAYKRAAERRLLPPDNYLAAHEKFGTDFRPEEYFPIKDFIIGNNN